jgi:hypothetical protein
MQIPGTDAGRLAAQGAAGRIPALARMGYAAKGIVYVLIGFIAFKAATAAGSPEGAAGALRTLADDSGGRAVLLAIALGLVGHVVWRLVQAARDPEHPRSDGKRVGMRLFYALSAAVYASIASTAWQLSRRAGTGADDGDGQRLWVGRLLDLPAGRWLVIAAGLGVVAYGLHQLYKALRGDVTRHLARVDAPVRNLGRFGVGARGAVLLPVGWLILRAGQTYDASAAAGTEGALRMIDRAGLLAVIGIGLVAYGLFQGVTAVYRRIDRPA